MEAHTTSYKTYWIAWFILLVATLIMVAMETSVFVVIVGMIFKSTVIAFWFMHLKYEKLGLILCVVLGIVFTSLLLFGLIAPDGMAM